MTPTLSVEAIHDREMLVAVEAVMVRPVGSVGACVSEVGGGGGGGLEHALVAIEPDASARFETFPAASKASKLTAYVVPQASALYV